jgi:hypothetical protein
MYCHPVDSSGLNERFGWANCQDDETSDRGQPGVLWPRL